MAFATPLVPPPLPTTIGLSGRQKLQLGRALGRGSASTVYRATLEGDFGLQRCVAAKVFHHSLREDDDVARSALANAVQRAACIRHPNVVGTYDFTLLDTRQPLLVRELVEGTTLHAFTDAYARSGRRVPLDLALFIAAEVAEALHGARIARGPDGVALAAAHLDLAPQEVLLSWHGEVKVADFGIGHAARWASSVRSLRAIAERASTMAPEVARGEAGDARSDVFSLGVMLREMLVGPRFASTVTEPQALEHARDGFVPSTFLELQLPKDVRAILARALEVDPARRFPHGTAVAYELRRVALAMGVGDARIFLKHALVCLREDAAEAGEAPPADIASGVRLDPFGDRPERTSGMIRKADHPDDDDDDDDLDEL